LDQSGSKALEWRQERLMFRPGNTSGWSLFDLGMFALAALLLYPLVVRLIVEIASALEH
jgi:hypothetical protein